MNHVLVTGATGSVGRHLVRLLHDAGMPVRALVRDPDSAAALLGSRLHLARGDLDDPASVRAAMDGVDRLFLASGNHRRQVERESTCIDAAVDAGVRDVVKLSAFGARPGAPVPFLDAHDRIEQRLHASGVRHHVLRPTFLMSNLLAAAGVVAATGRLFLPGHGASVAMIDPLDVARVAALLLADATTAPVLEPLSLTGPAALSFDDVAAHLSTRTGRPVAFVGVPDSAAREQMMAGGADPWFADGVVSQFRLLREGAQAQVSDTVRRVTGHAPRPLQGFLRDSWPVGAGDERPMTSPEHLAHTPEAQGAPAR